MSLNSFCYSTQDVAKKLGASYATVMYWINHKKLNAERTYERSDRGTYSISEKSLEDFLENNPQWKGNCFRMNSDEKYYTVSEAADYIGRSRFTVSRYFEKKGIAPVYISGVACFTEDSLNQLMEELTDPERKQKRKSLKERETDIQEESSIRETLQDPLKDKMKKFTSKLKDEYNGSSEKEDIDECLSIVEDDLFYQDSIVKACARLRTISDEQIRDILWNNSTNEGCRGMAEAFINSRDLFLNEAISIVTAFGGVSGYALMTCFESPSSCGNKDISELIIRVKSVVSVFAGRNNILNDEVSFICSAGDCCMKNYEVLQLINSK